MVGLSGAAPNRGGLDTPLQGGNTTLKRPH
jgi:hypothetical protein